MKCATMWVLGLVVGAAPLARAEVTPQELYERVSPSLVPVKFTWDSELGRRELTGAGIVVSGEGLVMTTLNVFDIRIPDQQMTEFKVLIPNQDKDPEELEAEFYGRDERTNLAFLKVKESRKWTPLKFEDAPVKIGERILSVGLLPEAAAFKTYFVDGGVSATLRGEYPQVLIYGGLAGVGSPVFNAEGKAIGMVPAQTGQSVFLNDGPNALAAINNPPKFFIPARDFDQSLKDPPTPKDPVVLPWIGVPAMTGLNKDVAEVFGLANQPAVQIGEVIEGTPADKAGLKQGDIVVKMNGEALERGDESEELPIILGRKLRRMAPGEKVKLSVLRKRGEPLTDIEITLAEQPKRVNAADRWYAEDLGFSARELVFADRYNRRLPLDAPGVAVAMIKPQSASQSAGLQIDDLIAQLNGEPVEGLEQFKKVYQQARKDNPREAVVLVVKRRGREDTVRIEPPR